MTDAYYPLDVTPTAAAALATTGTATGTLLFSLPTGLGSESIDQCGIFLDLAAIAGGTTPTLTWTVQVRTPNSTSFHTVASFADVLAAGHHLVFDPDVAPALSVVQVLAVLTNSGGNSTATVNASFTQAKGAQPSAPVWTLS